MSAMVWALFFAVLSALDFAMFARTGNTFTLFCGIVVGFCALADLALWVKS